MSKQPIPGQDPLSADLRTIALKAMKDAVRAGESQEMCARWISERYARALLPAPIPQAEDGFLDGLAPYVGDVAQDDYLRLIAIARAVGGKQ